MMIRSLTSSEPHLRITLGILLLLLFSACGENNARFSSAETPAEKSGSSVEVREYSTRSGKTFLLSLEQPLEGGEKKVTLETNGFEASNETFNLGELDPVRDVFLADLDDNGFEELYIVTRSTGADAESRIYAFVSNGDKSVTPAYVPEITEEQKAYGGLFDGYRGHNTFQVEEGRLINGFPVFLPEDHESEATGGERIVVYELIAGEAGWILKPVRREG